MTGDERWRATGNPGVSAVMTQAESDRLMNMLPTCKSSLSRQGKPKVSIPVRSIAIHIALLYGQRTYPCRAGKHFHLTALRDAAKVIDPHTKPFKTDNWPKLMQEARDRAEDFGRQRVYGRRTSTGKWIYFSHPAALRDTEQRSYRQKGQADVTDLLAKYGVRQ
jgi:hypothetical protein